MRTDEELKKSFKVYVNQEGIIHLEFLEVIKEHIDADRASELEMKALGEVLDRDPQKKYGLLVDMFNLKTDIYIFAGGIRTYSKWIRHPQLKKIALTGLPVSLKIVSNFVMPLIGGGKPVKSCPNKEDALAWLKS